MKRIYLLFICALVCVGASAQYEPTEAVKQSQEQFRNDKFGIFLHWGIYSMMANGEWVQNNKNLNADEYQHLADGFYPSKFDAEQWVKAFKDAGARYITITSRHHDGFSMFKTAQSDFNIVDGTPFHRDIIAKLAEACRKHGLHLHFYYSHLDWHRADYPLGWTGRKLGRPTDQQNWQSYYSFMNNQLRELLTQYGPIRCIWFDGIWDHDKDETPFDWQLDEQYQLIHQLQPQCLVANNHHRPPFPGEDIQVFEQDLPGENQWGYKNYGVSSLALESCVTMNGSWGYDMTDKNYKSTDEIVQTLAKTAGRDGNLLLNIGPRPDGQLPSEALERLKEIGQWMQVNGQSIYGTRGGCVPPQSWGVTTQCGNTLYMHILSKGLQTIYLPIAGYKVASAKMFGSQQKVKVESVSSGAVITLNQSSTGPDTIVELSLVKK